MACQELAQHRALGGGCPWVPCWHCHRPHDFPHCLVGTRRSCQLSLLSGTFLPGIPHGPRISQAVTWIICKWHLQ